MNILEDLKYRGLIYQITDEKELAKRLSKPIVLYCGFDPTAESLHLGNLLQILILKRFQNAGHKPIAIAGGGTGLIGDPSGKTQERKLNTQDVVNKNLKGIKKQLSKVLGRRVKVVNNADWLNKMKVIEYLRDYGKNFPVNQMLAKETIKMRLESGISFTEFNYMILQAIDFLELYKREKCELQIGGSDQWGNITAGTELIRRILSQSVFGLTVPLITKNDGSKFGKTESGTIWLDSEMTSSYEFYQFWINSSDEDVVRLIKFFTFLNKNEIEKLEKQVKTNPEKREAQKVLAQEVTKLVHEKKELKKAEKITRALFEKRDEIKKLKKDEIKQIERSIPSFGVKSKIKEFSLVSFLIDNIQPWDPETEVIKSKREARELITTGAISLNGEKCSDLEKNITQKDFLHGEYLIIGKGKKKYFLVKW